MGDWVQHEISQHENCNNDKQTDPPNFVPQHPKKSVHGVSRSCPICSERMNSAEEFYNHTARHLERISLFALPRHSGQQKESEGSGTDKASGQAEVDIDDSRRGGFSDNTLQHSSSDEPDRNLSEKTSPTQLAEASLVEGKKTRERINLGLFYLLPYSSRRQLEFKDITVSTTIKDLRLRIQDAITPRPAIERIYLTYRGCPVINNKATLVDALGKENVCCCVAVKCANC